MELEKGETSHGPWRLFGDPKPSYFSFKRRSNWGRRKKSQRIEQWIKFLTSFSSTFLSLPGFSKRAWEVVRLLSWEGFLAGCCLVGSVMHTALHNRTKETGKPRHTCHSFLWKMYARAGFGWGQHTDLAQGACFIPSWHAGDRRECRYLKVKERKEALGSAGAFEFLVRQRLKQPHI